jgi:hypothetical protein
VHTEFWCRNVNEKDHMEDVVVGGWIILKWILKSVGRARTGLA